MIAKPRLPGRFRRGTNDTGATSVLHEREKRIYNFLQANPVAVLSSVDASGQPHGCVIYFMLHDDFSLSFITKTGTKKYDNLQHNSQIMLTVYEPKQQVTAQIIGVVKEIKDGFTVNEVAAGIMRVALATSDTGIPPITKLVAGEYTAFDILPSQIRMVVFSRPDPGEYGDIFESLESFEFTPKQS